MFILHPGALALSDMDYLLRSKQSIMLEDINFKMIEKAHHQVKTICVSEQSVYGINTGFGLLAKYKIDKKDLLQLQNKLVMSHAVGVGPYLPLDIVKLILLLKINSLARGHSGVSVDLLKTLIDIYNADVLPLIPSQGSVGASGDLAPLAYVAMLLMGQGKVCFKGKIMDASQALKKAGILPIELQEKEGLSLLNGTQVSTAIAIMVLLKTQRNFALATIAGAISLDAAAGKIEAFHLEIAKLKNNKAQIKFCKVFQKLLNGSKLLENAKLKRRVQDPYCLRCQPQVMGAILTTLWDVEKYLMQEANAVSDNPLLFPELNLALSGGNFHAELTAFQADFLSIAGSEIGSISERRIAFLIDKHMSGLPDFLVDTNGLNSGFMIAQVTAAALASENKTYAHPASVDSIPTSGHQEDHVSMATFAGMKGLKVTENVLHILALEILAACQALDFRKPLATSPTLMNIYEKVRNKVAFYQDDRFLGTDVITITELIAQRDFYEKCYREFFY